MPESLYVVTFIVPVPVVALSEKQAINTAITLAEMTRLENLQPYVRHITQKESCPRGWDASWFIPVTTLVRRPTEPLIWTDAVRLYT
jgi:hypothetical protein